MLVYDVQLLIIKTAKPKIEHLALAYHAGGTTLSITINKNIKLKGRVLCSMSQMMSSC
jgi:hypothetical protein